MDKRTSISLLYSIRDRIQDELEDVLRLRNLRTQKSDLSYVTEGDLLVQKICMQEIGRLSMANIVVISEENNCRNETPVGDQITIVIDPIDGTENFTSGLPEWGISIAIYSGLSHMASMIGCPENSTWYFSGHLPEQSFESRIHGLSSSLSKKEIDRAGSGYEYRVMGCCVYNMINVIRGSFKSFENPKGANSWDILGGLNLALEKGLCVSVNEVKYAGEYLSPDRKYRFKIENK